MKIHATDYIVVINGIDKHRDILTRRFNTKAYHQLAKLRFNENDLKLKDALGSSEPVVALIRIKAVMDLHVEMNNASMMRKTWQFTITYKFGRFTLRKKELVDEVGTHGHIPHYANECLTLEPSNRETTADLYDSYTAWMDKNGAEPLVRQAFFKHLYKHYEGKMKTTRMSGKSRQRAYMGVRIL